MIPPQFPRLSQPFGFYIRNYQWQNDHVISGNTWWLHFGQLSPLQMICVLNLRLPSLERVLYDLNNFTIINIGRMPLSTSCIYILSSLALQNTFLGFSYHHRYHLLSPSILLPHSPLKSDQMSGEESIMLGKPNSPSGSPAAAAAPPPLRPSWPLSDFGYGGHPDMTSDYKQIY